MRFYRQDCREAAICWYYIYPEAKNQVYRPAGATRCTDSRQTWSGRRARGSAWLRKNSQQSVECGPKIWKKFHFLVKSRLAGANLYTDF